MIERILGIAVLLITAAGATTKGLAADPDSKPPWIDPSIGGENGRSYAVKFRQSAAEPRRCRLESGRGRLRGAATISPRVFPMDQRIFNDLTVSNLATESDGRSAVDERPADP